MAGDNKSKLLREAERYVLQGKIAHAIAEYLKIIKNDPNDVLTLNTVGDLCLRQGKVADARKYFAHVADHYARNNFLLKAIAVYRKILNADPENLEVNLTLASLYVKQGLTVEARNQFLRVAELHADAGKTRESLECYEKAVELDPMNSAVQLRLADINLAEGNREKAHSYFAGAARAQSKACDFADAVNSFKRAAELNPVNIEVLRGFLEASIQIGNVSAVLEQLKKSLEMAQDNMAIREMLGQAYLTADDPENASKVFQEVLAQDPAHYEDMFRVSKAFLEHGDAEQAACCLDSAVPIMISRRETERGVDAYNRILKSNPQHALTLTRLAALYSATNNLPKYVETLGLVAGYYMSQHSPSEALLYLLKIFQIEPENQKYLAMHHQAFTEAYPDKPYEAPVAQERSDSGADVPEASRGRETSAADSAAASIFVDIDLLQTYGMADKALDRLCALEKDDPWNPEIRRRMLSLYQDIKQHEKAAEQALMLAALELRDNDDVAAQKFLAEARKLAPEMVEPGFDLEAFAQRQGIIIQKGPAKQEPPTERLPGIELDLSGDLSEMFFKDAAESESAEDTDTDQTADSESASDEYTPEAGILVLPGSIDEQLQEVDFYIRLGFHNEARAKLDALSKDHPNNPELPLRYRMLPAQTAKASAAAAGDVDARSSPTVPEIPPPVEGAIVQEMKIDQVVEHVVENSSSEPIVKQPLGSEESLPAMNVLPLEPIAEQSEQGNRAPSPDPQINSMFADLIDEVNSLTDQDIAREDFETHFNLGIAYREMDLLEDAIKEFQDAAKAVDPGMFPKEVIQCCGLLSTCFLDKGMPKSAIRWCQTGLSVTEISSHEAMALRYDMGVAYSATGENEKALECFGFIFRADPSYRDVAQKIDQLRSGPESHGS